MSAFQEFLAMLFKAWGYNPSPFRISKLYTQKDTDKEVLDVIDEQSSNN